MLLHAVCFWNVLHFLTKPSKVHLNCCVAVSEEMHGIMRYIVVIQEDLILCLHRCFSGRMLPCNAGGPGSIQGRCTFLFYVIFPLLEKYCCITNVEDSYGRVKYFIFNKDTCFRSTEMPLKTRLSSKFQTVLN